MNERVQWSLAMAMIIVLLVCIVAWFSIDNNFLRIGLIFFIVPLYSFLATPAFKLYKKFIYVSPMLLFMKRGEDTYELHSGTSFDYLFVMRSIPTGIKWRNKMLQYYLEGLIEIVERIKSGEIPHSAEINGTSYFMSNSLTKKIGFNILESGPMERLIFIVDYLDLIWMHSLANGQLSFPRFSNLKKAVITGDQLLKAEKKLIKYNNYIKSKY